MIKHLIPPGTRVAPTGRPQTTMLPDFILPWDFDEELDAGIVGVPFNFHNTFQATSQGPGGIREWFQKFATRSHDFEVDISDLKVRDIGDIQMHPTEVLRCHDNIEEGLSELYKQSPSFIPIIFGGNHAIAAPSIRAFRNGNDYKKVGLVDFDAHNDLGDPSNRRSYRRHHVQGGHRRGPDRGPERRADWPPRLPGLRRPTGLRKSGRRPRDSGARGVAAWDRPGNGRGHGSGRRRHRRHLTSPLTSTRSRTPRCRERACPPREGSLRKRPTRQCTCLAETGRSWLWTLSRWTL